MRGSANPDALAIVLVVNSHYTPSKVAVNLFGINEP